MIGSTFDVLPSPVNLKRWRIDQCELRMKPRGSLKPVLSCCGALLSAYTWRHNQVLWQMAEVTCKAGQRRKDKWPQKEKGIKFVKEGQKERTLPWCLWGVSSGRLGGVSG